MKTVLLLLFTMHQMFFISNALKCYECEGDCKEPKEKECDAAIKCCFSSVAPVGGAAGGGGGGGGGGAEATTAAETPAPRMKRNIIGGRSDGESKRRGLFKEFLQDEEAPEPSPAPPEEPSGEGAGGEGKTEATTEKKPAGGSEKDAPKQRKQAGNEEDEDPTKHKFKGCCEELTKEVCKNDELCYLCESDLCNKEDSGSSASIALASILNILLPLAIIGVTIGSSKKFIN